MTYLSVLLLYAQSIEELANFFGHTSICSRFLELQEVLDIMIQLASNMNALD